MRDLYENAVKCSFRRARRPRAIRLDVQFMQDLSPKRARGAAVFLAVIGNLIGIGAADRCTCQPSRPVVHEKR